MTWSIGFVGHSDWLVLLLRVLLVGLAIALALAPSLAGGTPILVQAGGLSVAQMGVAQPSVVAGVTNAPASPPAEPSPGVPPPEFWPGGDCAFTPVDLAVA